MKPHHRFIFIALFSEFSIWIVGVEMGENERVQISVNVIPI